MRIPVIIEPNYRHSVWCKQTLTGMFDEAKRKKYSLVFVDGNAYAYEDYDALFSGNKRLVILIGTSVSWIPETLSMLERKGVHGLLVSFETPSNMMLQGVVRMDYVSAMHQLMQYYAAHGRTRVALYGFNPNSSADRIKEQYFCTMRQAAGDEQPQRHVFYNYAALGRCFEAFQPHADEYDALICANDIVAVSAIRHLREAGVPVPDRMFIAGFGESVLSRTMHPSITTATLDHEEMGQQAITLYAYLTRQEANVVASVRVQSKLLARESTRCLPVVDTPPVEFISERVKSVDFYSDDEVQSLLALEEFYLTLDDLDVDILRLLGQNVTLEAIAQICCTTVSTVGYHLRRMQAKIGVASREELYGRVIRNLMEEKE